MIWIKNINNNMKIFLNKRATKLDNDNNLINKTSNNININIINDINKLVYDNPFISRQTIIDTINNKYKIKLLINKAAFNKKSN